LAAWWCAEPRWAVAVNATVGLVEPDRAAAEAQAKVAAGFGALKLKLGPADGGDVERLTAVRRAVGHGVELRGDANGAWSRREALERLRLLAEFELAYVEQPVPAADVAGLAWLRQRSPVAVAADDALLLPGGPRRVLQAGAADVVVLKPALLGGPFAAWEIAEAAQVGGIPAVVTTALDAAVGRLGALHLAAALAGSFPDGRWPACGLATGDLLADDVAATPTVERGVMTVSREPGLGVEPGGGFELI
jgi:L-alanine-DL-glutamate epimerase-like enolase superfamily enzyme